MRRVGPSSAAIALPACALAGLLHALSFAPWNLPALELAALTVLAAVACRQQTWRAAAACGLTFGLAWFGVGVSWVYISMHTFGQMPAWIAALATAALAAYLALFPAMACAACSRVNGSPSWRLLLAWPSAWSVSELLRGWLLTGMPWIASGYAHTDGPLAGYAAFAGVYGIVLVAAFIAGAFALLLEPGDARLRLQRASALLAALALLGAGQWLRGAVYTTPAGAPITVELIQGNIAQDLKFADNGVDLAARQYLPLLADAEAARVDLVVLPESAFPLALGDLPPQIAQALTDFVHDRDRALVFGTFIEEPAGHYYNSAIGLQHDRPAQRYSKRHLVPFGEFIPFGFRWFIDLMNMPIGDQEQGRPRQAPMALAGQRLAINICFEDLFGREILDAWEAGGGEPTMLLNLSNLAWFGDSIALAQHLQFSRMRALETGRPLLQATNSGITAIIDAGGRVQASLPAASNLGAGRPPAQRLVAQVRGYAGRTPYIRRGDAPVIVASALMAAAAFGVRRTASREKT